MCSLNKNNNKIKFLTPQNLLIIINKFKPKSINLTGMGETLLNPHFHDFLKTCYQENISTSFITNLQLLNSKHLEALKKYPPTSISVSMESGIKKYYEKTRFGAKYDITVKNIKALILFINKHNLPTKVIINTAFLDFNLKDLSHLKKIIDLAANLNISKVTFQNINLLSPFINKQFRSQHIISIYKNIQEYADHQKVIISLPSPRLSSAKCYYPWVYPQITATGDILPCCVIPQFGNYQSIIKKYSFGNIFHKSLKHTWNSKNAKNFRANMSTNSLCVQCSKYQGVL